MVSCVPSNNMQLHAHAHLPSLLFFRMSLRMGANSMCQSMLRLSFCCQA